MLAIVLCVIVATVGSQSLSMMGQMHSLPATNNAQQLVVGTEPAGGDAVAQELKSVGTAAGRNAVVEGGGQGGRVGGDGGIGAGGGSVETLGSIIKEGIATGVGDKAKKIGGGDVVHNVVAQSIGALAGGGAQNEGGAAKLGGAVGGGAGAETLGNIIKEGIATGVGAKLDKSGDVSARPSTGNLERREGSGGQSSLSREECRKGAVQSDGGGLQWPLYNVTEREDWISRTKGVSYMVPGSTGKPYPGYVRLAEDYAWGKRGLGLLDPVHKARKFYVYSDGFFNMDSTFECVAKKYKMKSPAANPDSWFDNIDDHMSIVNREYFPEVTLIKALLDHPQRTLDPEEADLFFIGFAPVCCFPAFSPLLHCFQPTPTQPSISKCRVLL